MCTVTQSMWLRRALQLEGVESIMSLLQEGSDFKQEVLIKGLLAMYYCIDVCAQDLYFSIQGFRGQHLKEISRLI